MSVQLVDYRSVYGSPVSLSLPAGNNRYLMLFIHRMDANCTGTSYTYNSQTVTQLAANNYNGVSAAQYGLVIPSNWSGSYSLVRTSSNAPLYTEVYIFTGVNPAVVVSGKPGILESYSIAGANINSNVTSAAKYMTTKSSGLVASQAIQGASDDMTMPSTPTAHVPTVGSPLFTYSLKDYYLGYAANLTSTSLLLALATPPGGSTGWGVLTSVSLNPVLGSSLGAGSTFF